MKILICGSRYFEDYELLKEKMNAHSNITEIIHGAARGADTLAGRYGVEIGVPVTAYPADWGLYGKSAGPIRNTQMLREGRPDMVIAFRGPESRGTRHMIEIAEKAGIPTEIVDVGCGVYLD